MELLRNAQGTNEEKFFFPGTERIESIAIVLETELESESGKEEKEMSLRSGARRAVGVCSAGARSAVRRDRAWVEATHRPFTGHVQRYGEMLRLFRPDRFALNASFLEFHDSDVALREPLPMLVTQSGLSISCSRIWVRKGSLAKQVSSFEIK